MERGNKRRRRERGRRSKARKTGPVYLTPLQSQIKSHKTRNKVTPSLSSSEKAFLGNLTSTVIYSVPLILLFS